MLPSLIYFYSNVQSRIMPINSFHHFDSKPESKLVGLGAVAGGVMPMLLQQLITFCAVVDERGFTACGGSFGYESACRE